MKIIKLVSLIFFLTFMVIQAQDDPYKILPGNTDTLQYSYFLDRLQEQFDQRREEINIESGSETMLLVRRDRLRAQFAEMIGKLPPKCSLNPKVNRKIETESFTMEAVSFESRPNHHVTALFYLPSEGKAPFPAVYIPCGHSANGKAYESYQKAARLFVKNGFAVLQADPICQGERYQLLDDKGKPKTGGGTLMHEFIGQALALTGSSTLEHELYDNIRCIDFLEQHPSVDKDRLAVAGNSGGGTQTTFLVAYDRRIKAATPACFIATTEKKMVTHGIGDFCQHVWWEGKYRMDEQDFLFMAAPAPICILSGEKDFFPIEGAREAYRELKSFYTVLGIPEKAGHTSCNEPHGWHKPLREASVHWCRKWLLDNAEAVTEPDDIGYFKDEEIYASPTGQVLSSFENEQSLFDIIEDRVADCRMKREDFRNNSSFEEIHDKIKELIGYEEPLKSTNALSKGVVNKNAYQVEKLLLERDRTREFFLPALLFVPDGAKRNSPATIIINEDGKNAELGSESRIGEELKKGHIVLAIDISDTGELKDRKQFPASHSNFFTAKFPLYEGKTLLGYRTEDIIIATRYLRSHQLADKNNIRLVSKGNTGYAALHAAAISAYFSTVELTGDIESWEDVATSEFHSNEQLSRMDNIVPDVLNYYDIPELTKMMSGTIVQFTE